MNLALQQWQRLVALKPRLTSFEEQANAALSRAWAQRHKHFTQWLSAIEGMPSGYQGRVDLCKPAPVLEKELSDVQYQALYQGLKELMPWRKGPFMPCGIALDSEWRSDFKYQRLRNCGVDVADKHILDVGCGNGYFMLRMLGDGAALTIGVDPSWHYFAQFLALQKLYSTHNTDANDLGVYHEIAHHDQGVKMPPISECRDAAKMVYLPLTLDDVLLNDMDITLSMGVLYHRRDPMQHLWQLRETLRKGGQLVVETLVVDGDEQTVFMPPERYAGMSNVWFLPSPAALCRWLTRLGLEIEYCSDAIATTRDEQRSTPWLDRYSLDDFMQPDYRATIEGLPPPKRLMVVARKP